MEITARRSIWPILVYKDGPAAIRFLVEAFGFEETAVYADDKDESLIVMRSFDGRVVVGSWSDRPKPGKPRSASDPPVPLLYTSSPTIPTPCTRASSPPGARSLASFVTRATGPGGFTARDSEGNLWSFGAYAGE
jgi:uncharacterized glyoxalase superfamily protein PhnB